MIISITVIKLGDLTLNNFTAGVIVTVGILASGVIFMSSLDESSQHPPYDKAIINALENMEYEKMSGNDIHYERIDREGTYFASMEDIELIKEKNDDSIRITFHEKDFRFEKMENTSHDSKFVTTISKGQTFVAGCTYKDLSDFRTSEKENLVKFLTIMRYNGITEKDGINYYKFIHDEGYVINDIECVFPNMIELSINIEFDIRDNNFLGEVWDRDWN